MESRGYSRLPFRKIEVSLLSQRGPWSKTVTHLLAEDADLFVNDILCQKQIDRAGAFRNAWTCTDSGLPYHHMGNVAAQLEAAALVAQRNRELEGEDGGDGGSDECPINWQGNKQGFAGIYRILYI